MSEREPDDDMQTVTWTRTVIVLAAVTVAWFPCGATRASAQERTAADSSSREADERDATQAALDWLQLVDDGKYAESWEQAAAAFKRAVTKGAWEHSVVAARSAFEPFGERTIFVARYTTELPNAQPGEYFILQYRTQVPGRRTVVETVVPMRDSDGSWRVAGYFVRPE